MQGRTRRMTAVVFVSAVVALGCTGDDAARSSGTTDAAVDAGAAGPIEVVNTDPWPMHHVDGRFRGANALGGADVNGDGHTDYITNYEFDQRWVVSIHPGDEGDPTVSWPTVEVWRPEPFAQGNGKNPESSALGDFDGDGNVDAVGAHGFSDFVDLEGSAPGIHLVWGPPAAETLDPAAWEDGGWVPATVDVGHPHWVVAHDVNGDGLTDVAFGGRRHGGGGGYDSPDSPNGNGTLTGIGWLEAPEDPRDRRDLSAWRVHRIDPDTPSGHGFVFADLDGDGDDDIVDANADFDTPEADEQVAWYENPGDGLPEQRQPWRRTVLLESSDFWAKPSVAVGDLDGDGDPDVVTQTDRELILFRNDGGDAVSFETVRVAKPEAIRWLSRPLRLADMDRDGDLDVFGMLLHEDNVLPADKAAAFLLRNDGDPFSPAGWDLVPVRWGSGRTMDLPGFGEKWDQVDIVDVDGDGDLDAVANCEEWWATPQFAAAPFFTPGLQVSSVAVVWFENTLGEAAPVATETDGMIEVEAEQASLIGDSTWVERSPVTGDTAVGGEAPVRVLQALNGLRPPGAGLVPAAATAGSTYLIEAAGGAYAMWARVWVPEAFAPDIGGATADSAWLSEDDGPALVLGDDDGATGRWRWVRLGERLRLAEGEHRVTLRVRERGFAVDRMALTTDRTWRPGSARPGPVRRPGRERYRGLGG